MIKLTLSLDDIGDIEFHKAMGENAWVVVKDSDGVDMIYFESTITGKDITRDINDFHSLYQ